MNVIRRLALHAAAVAAVGFPCRAAFALESGGPANADATSTQPPAPNREAASDTGKKEERPAGSRRTDHFRIGVLGGVGFPRPLAIEAMVKVERMIGLGVEYSVLPTLRISGVETSFYAIAADTRVFPFRDAFFVGLRAGRQHLGGDADVTIQGYGSVHEAIAVDTTFVNPRIGFLWTWEPGITLGLDVGVQVPLSSSSSSSIPEGLARSTPQGITAADDIVRVTNTLGKNTLPTVDLLRVGFLL